MANLYKNAKLDLSTTNLTNVITAATGSTIIVNERLISSQNRITGWEAFSTITSQAGSIATTLLSLALIANQTNGQ